MEGLDLFHGPNAGYALDLYDDYLRDRASVDPRTRAIFDLLPLTPGVAAPARTNGAFPPLAGANGAMTAPGPNGARAARAARAATAATAATATPLVTTTVGTMDLTAISNAARLARNIRGRGHLAARIDPLGSEPRGNPGLNPDTYNLTPTDLAALPAEVVGGPAARDAANAGEAIDRLRTIYEGTTGYDYSHVHEPNERLWLREVVESRRFDTPLSAREQRALLERLTRVEALERFLHQNYRDQKRFSIEGTDALIPMLDEIVRAAAGVGTREVVIGMAHRGRLNVMAHVLGMPYDQLIEQFRDASAHPVGDPAEGANIGYSGDVKYHLGASGVSQQMTLTLASNPSHLEFVDPVIEGMARAIQDHRDRAGTPAQDENAALPIMIHGDAAFPGEGIVAETLNLSRLAGYRTGGAIHIIINNQLGFTTEPQSSRSTLYASDLAKGFEIPIVHVNADDPAACVAATRLAYAYREAFHKDVLIDLVGYRRYGHNEGDEPAYTQPLLYKQIDTHPTVRALWARELDRAGVLPLAEASRMLDEAVAALKDINRRLATPAPAPDPSAARKEGAVEDAPPAAAIATALPSDTLAAYNDQLLRFPEGFAPHPRLARQLERRRAALGPDGSIDWAHAESLAFAATLANGTPIRLTGQDTERGTFSQRHIVLHDAATGATYTPLQRLPAARASFAVYNSSLSEAGALGFEYGYNVHAPETLVLWEAQYGDFANTAQVIVDQFIVAARAKWRQYPSLVLLLPHGYEGSGPEHSSARLERYLQLAANDNLYVAYPTTAAQYFHLLRRHVALLRTDPRPLVVMTPKSLLRHQRATSRSADLTHGLFHSVLDDPDVTSDERRGEVTRLVLCSGKVYVDLVGSAERTAATGVAIARVEQLYPFPDDELAALLAAYPQLGELVWLQEEPRNMGAWLFAAPHLQELAARRGVTLSYIGRSERASPAAGSSRRHTAEQDRIVAEAFSGVRTLVESRK